MQRDEQDKKANVKPEQPCEICGRHSEAKSWGHALCYGERDGSRLGCITQLFAAVEQLPGDADVREFTHRWVAEQKRGAA